MDTTKSFASTGTCFGKITSTTNFAMKVNGVKVFFKDPTQNPPPYIGLTIKGTNLEGTTTPLYTFDETAHSGWNYVSLSGVYSSIEVGGANGCDHINEIEVNGDVIYSSSLTTESCTISLQGASDSPVTITGTVSYQDSETASITSISPNFGSAFGGDLITITGTELTTNLELFVGGKKCLSVSEVTSGTSYTCITDMKKPGSKDTLYASLNGKGVSLSSSVIFTQYYDWSNPETW